jgi:hypothetical protein
MKRITLAGALAAVLALALASSAPAATPQEVQQSVTSAADWIRTQQGPNPFEPAEPYSGGIAGFGGDWAATALGAAGVDAAAVVNPTYGPQSLQDHLEGEYSEASWTEAPGTGEFPRPATDFARAALVSYAAGIDPARVAADSNLPAQLAGLWNQSTGSFGTPSTNGTVFGILALKHTAVPDWALAPSVSYLRRNQHTDGGWEYGAATTPAAKATPSTADMTGAAIAAFCEAGVPAYDPQVAEGLEFLRKNLNEDGGFEYPYGGPNSDTNGWAISGLNACGIDPQSADWTTTAGKTPVDYLLSLQITTPGPDAGSFGYNEPEGANLYSTQDALRALAGGVFTATPASLRTPPTVSVGTPVPHTVAIRFSADSVRMCQVTAPVGASLIALLEAGRTSSYPAGCISSLSVSGGKLTALNGVAPANANEAWLARLDRGVAAQAESQGVGFGDVVSLWLGAPGSEGGGGPAGPAGPAGPSGPAGQAGATGASGATGANGEAGATGSTGATGPAGPAGPAGKQGKQGKQGPRGPQGKSGKNGKNAKAKAKRSCRSGRKAKKPAARCGSKHGAGKHRAERGAKA